MLARQTRRYNGYMLYVIDRLATGCCLFTPALSAILTKAVIYVALRSRSKHSDAGRALTHRRHLDFRLKRMHDRPASVSADRHLSEHHRLVPVPLRVRLLRR